MLKKRRCRSPSLLLGTVSGVLFATGTAFAEWSPLISSDDFTGPQADIMTTVGGLLLVALVVMAAGLVMSMLKGGR